MNLQRAAAGRKVLVLARYPARVASARLRTIQYFPYLREKGFDPSLVSFIPAHLIDQWFGSSNLQRVRILAIAFLRLPRLAWAVRGSCAVIVQREFIPLGPPFIEWIVSRRRPLIWDVDDAVWEPYPSLFLRHLPSWLRKTGRKFERLCRMATEVWAGSEVLATWCRQHNARVRVLPTVVSVPDELPERRHSWVVGWIGSPSTGQFLENILPSLECIKPQPTILAVGSDIADVPGLALQARGWSHEAEDETLARMAVGLYPIDLLHPLAEGKCGFKAVLYMSRGIPSVVTPTRTNASIVRDQIEGLHAGSPEEWTAAIETLLRDEALWQRLRRASYERARRDFSLQHWGPLMANHVDDLVSPHEHRDGSASSDRLSAAE